MTKILIAGGTGFIGRALCDVLRTQYQVTILTRNKRHVERLPRKYAFLEWSALSSTTLAEYEAIINLAGENVAAGRWTPARKKAILSSRVTATKKLVAAILNLERPPFLINASAIGIYPSCYQETPVEKLTEEAALDKPADFLSQVAIAWEQALLPLKEKNIPHAVTRFGVVLGRDGGMLKQLLPSFRWGLGSVVGSGAQGLSWVHREDVVAAMRFLLIKKCTGVYNLAAPQVTTQREFAKTLATVLHRPCFLKLPASVVQLLFGEMGQALLLSGQWVSSDHLQSTGFTFQYPELRQALEDCVKSVMGT